MGTAPHVLPVPKIGEQVYVPDPLESKYPGYQGGKAIVASVESRKIGEEDVDFLTFTDMSGRPFPGEWTWQHCVGAQQEKLTRRFEKNQQLAGPRP